MPADVMQLVSKHRGFLEHSDRFELVKGTAKYAHDNRMEGPAAYLRCLGCGALCIPCKPSNPIRIHMNSCGDKPLIKRMSPTAAGSPALLHYHVLHGWELTA